MEDSRLIEYEFKTADGRTDAFYTVVYNTDSPILKFVDSMNALDELFDRKYISFYHIKMVDANTGETLVSNKRDTIAH